MRLIRHIATASLLLRMILLTLSATGQETITKSGTLVRPAERIPAVFSLDSKSASLLSDSTAGTYIAVTRPDLLEPLQPLLQWKRQQGYRVETLCVETNNRDSIRARLLQRYMSSNALQPAQRYVLIVGDVDRIQAFNGRYTPSGLTNRYSDMYYGEYTDDYVPEAYVGRLSVTDSGQLASVVAKIIAYEQGQWAGHAKRLLLAAGSENRNPAPTTTNGQVNYLAEMASQYRPDVDTICFRNPNSLTLKDSLLEELGQGNALVNYTAHCTTRGWENPTITFNGIDTLGNPIPTLFVNNCCLSNAIENTCFGEQLLRRSTGGAVGVIGASNETLWDEDYYWAVGAKCPPAIYPSYDSGRAGAFDTLLVFSSEPANAYAEGYTLGAMLHAGCRAVSMSGSPYDAFYWEIYSLLGEPAMMPFLGEADTLEWSLPDSMMAGSSMLHISCTPFCRITAMEGSTMLATTMSDADGNAILWLTHSLDDGEVTLTATRPNAIPLISNLPIAHPLTGCIAVTDCRWDDEGLQVGLKNVGLQPALRHDLCLTQDSSDLVMGFATTTPITINIAALNPQQDTTVMFLWNGLEVGSEPLFSAHILAADSTHTPYSNLHLLIPAPDLRPQIVQFTVEDSLSCPIQRIIPRHNYLFKATISHPADSSILEIAGQHIPAVTDSLTCLFPFLIESDSDHLPVTVTTYKDHWQHQQKGWILPYDTWERFETGDFDNLPWELDGPNPWIIDSAMAHEGHFSARSAPIGDVQKSTLGLTLKTLTDDTVAFYYNVSSEAHDWLYFYLDGKRVGYWSGNSGWGRYTRVLPAGKHHLMWVYQKDAAISERNDCAHIDDLRLPLALWAQPYGTSETTPTLSANHVEGGNNEFRIYPNPSSGVAYITTPTSSQAQQIMVYDMNGRVVDKIFIAPNCNSTQYFTHTLRFGIYSLALQSNNGTLIKKLIVTK